MPAPMSPAPGPAGRAGDAEYLEFECMSEDDFETDELLDDDSEGLDVDRPSDPGGNVPVWRLIEMSRENRYLKREIADFEDYDRYFGDGYAH